jgi:hypothetical protein
VFVNIGVGDARGFTSTLGDFGARFREGFLCRADAFGQPLLGAFEIGAGEWRHRGDQVLDVRNKVVQLPPALAGCLGNGGLRVGSERSGAMAIPLGFRNIWIPVHGASCSIVS